MMRLFNVAAGFFLCLAVALLAVGIFAAGQNVALAEDPDPGPGGEGDYSSRCGIWPDCNTMSYG